MAALARSAASIAALLPACVLAAACGRGAEPGSRGWGHGAPMPTARSEMGAVVHEGLVYVAGGIHLLGSTAAFEVYDPKHDAWRELAPLPEPRNHAAVASFDGRVLVTGGFRDARQHEMTDTVYAYDPARGSWSELAPLPSPRAAHAAAADGSRLYLVGGSGEAAREVWSYVSEEGGWTASAPPLPEPRDHAAALVAGRKLHLVGGRSGGLPCEDSLVLDLDRLSWTSVPGLAVPRGGAAAGLLGTTLHVAGGETFEPRATYATHEVFDPGLSEWRPLPPMPTRRHGAVGAVAAGRFFVIGGGRSPRMMTLLTSTDRVEFYPEESP